MCASISFCLLMLCQVVGAEGTATRAEKSSPSASTSTPSLTVPPFKPSPFTENGLGMPVVGSPSPKSTTPHSYSNSSAPAVSGASSSLGMWPSDIPRLDWPAPPQGIPTPPLFVPRVVPPKLTYQRSAIDSSSNSGKDLANSRQSDFKNASRAYQEELENVISPKESGASLISRLTREIDTAVRASGGPTPIATRAENVGSASTQQPPEHRESVSSSTSGEKYLWWPRHWKASPAEKPEQFGYTLDTAPSSMVFQR